MSLNIKIQKNEILSETFWGKVAIASIIFEFASALMDLKYKYLGKDTSKKGIAVIGAVAAAFFLSRKKLKSSKLPQDQQIKIDQILTNAENEIKRRAEEQSTQLKTNPSMQITIDKDIEIICNDAVIKISSIVKDKKAAEEIVTPIRTSFENALSGFSSLRKDSAMQSLMQNSNLKSSILKSVNGNSAAADKILFTIFDRISKTVKG